jgi:hypothetical protein
MLNFNFIPIQNATINFRNRYPLLWQIARTKIYSEAGYECEICSKTWNRPVECHEQWNFDLIALEQTLEDLICVCWKCHTAIHLNQYTLEPKKYAIVIKHLLKINNWSLSKFLECYEIAIVEWKIKSKYLFIYRTGDVEKRYSIPAPHIQLRTK